MTTPSALKYVRPLLAGLVAVGLLAGFAAKFGGLVAWSDMIWAAVTLPVLVALLVEIVTSLRRGDVGLDIVAALSMTAALTVGENLAAAIVALMYAGGQYLEAFAERHARREMTALLARVPRTALRHRDCQLEEVALDALRPGDRLLIRQGDVVPVDGKVVDGVAVLDQSALTGEAMPVQLKPGQAALSGSTNVGDAFDLEASRLAAESTYAGVVRLVEAAQRSRAPMARLADRYAMVFLAVTAVMAAAAWWLTGESGPRGGCAGGGDALSTHSGGSGGYRRRPVPRGQARHPDQGRQGDRDPGAGARAGHRQDRHPDHRPGQIVSIHAAEGVTPDEVLRIAASLDQASKHIIAQTIVAEARSKGLLAGRPVRRGGDRRRGAGRPGRGPSGHGRRLAFHCRQVGTSPALALLGVRAAARRAGSAVAADGKLIGVLILADELRAGTEQLLRALRDLGIERIVLATGDRHEVANFFSRRPVHRSGALGTHPRPEDPGGAVGAQERPGDDDRGRRQ